MAANAKSDPALTPDAAIDHILGPGNARVTLIEYGDLECPSCGQAHGAVQQLRSRYARDVRFVFRHFPLAEVHPHAERAAQAAEAAGGQGRFWQYVDLLFSHQSHLGDRDLIAYAQQLGLEMPRFENELSDEVYRQRVNEHVALGTHLRVRATPTFYVNGQMVDVSFGLQRLEDAVQAALAG